MPARFVAGRQLRRILLATDFSASAQAALPHAARLAALFGAKVYVAHIIELHPWEVAPEVTLHLRIDATRKLDQVLLGPELRGIAAQAMVRQGGVTAELLHLAQEHDIDLVVTGTRSRRGLSHLLSASAAERLAQSAPCPVLAVGPHARPPDGKACLRNIVLATTLNRGAAAGIAYARWFAHMHGAKLWMAHSMQPHTAIDQRSSERWLRQLAPDQPRVERVADVGSVEQVTIVLAERERADLVMLAPGLGSLLPLVTRYVSCPVMAVRYAIPMIRPKTLGAELATHHRSGH